MVVKPPVLVLPNGERERQVGAWTPRRNGKKLKATKKAKKRGARARERQATIAHPKRMGAWGYPKSAAHRGGWLLGIPDSNPENQNHS
jgi:hypothetical protein